ncbi:hypothetical protein PoB_001436600 [Plakobranchus ocellatus]|uniref:Uncharacterized protein n=1 Tax=Plakobranchus ocellatus TaxID=259542 RepID=A0AAV3YKR4_9GAST|nr:hypothetical protein PoB_001436600 [Plakobranchus ocellatus]
MDAAQKFHKKTKDITKTNMTSDSITSTQLLQGKGYGTPGTRPPHSPSPPSGCGPDYEAVKKLFQPDQAHLEQHRRMVQDISGVRQELVSALSRQIDEATIEIRAVTNDSMDITQEYLHLLSNELGTFPDYKHKILRTKDVEPSLKKLRPVPLERYQKVSEEIQNMFDLGIWESTDKSSWVHHMITVPKPKGD